MSLRLALMIEYFLVMNSKRCILYQVKRFADAGVKTKFIQQSAALKDVGA